jgi:hypothetical protein
MNIPTQTGQIYIKGTWKKAKCYEPVTGLRTVHLDTYYEPFALDTGSCPSRQVEWLADALTTLDTTTSYMHIN